MSSLNWRYIYFLTIGLRFLFALSDSYIHPDEHFQSVEIMSSFLGYTNNEPWEFTSDQPARSYGPLVLFYGPIFMIAKLCGPQLSPVVIWYLVRLQFMVVTWIVTDICLFKMLPTKQERTKAIFFVLTSYVTHVYQSHTFSNSVETWLVMVVILTIDSLRYNQESNRPELTSRSEHTHMFTIGLIIAIGIFNRVTMPAFIIFPSWFVAKHVFTHPLSALTGAIAFFGTSIVFVWIDTRLFNSQSPVIAPLNNLVYNSSYDNLAHHGIHPLYTHLLVNLPQLLGPGLIYLIWGFKNPYWKTTPFLAAGGGLLVLSVVPHQEVRFLIPVVPLLTCCFNLRPFAEKDHKHFARPLLGLWYAFNVALAILMGIFHQGGVVPGLEHVRNTQSGSHATYVWWRTYSPPIWILGDQNHEVQSIEIVNGIALDEIDPLKEVSIIDAKGTDLAKLKPYFVKDNYVVTPRASYETELMDTFAATEVFCHGAHIDMDHLDWSDYRSLKPGLCIYRLL